MIACNKAQRGFHLPVVSLERVVFLRYKVSVGGALENRCPCYPSILSLRVISKSALFTSQSLSRPCTSSTHLTRGRLGRRAPPQPQSSSGSLSHELVTSFAARSRQSQNQTELAERLRESLKGIKGGFGSGASRRAAPTAAASDSDGRTKNGEERRRKITIPRPAANHAVSGSPNGVQPCSVANADFALDTTKDHTTQ